MGILDQSFASKKSSLERFGCVLCFSSYIYIYLCIVRGGVSEYDIVYFLSYIMESLVKALSDPVEYVRLHLMMIEEAILSDVCTRQA